MFTSQDPGPGPLLRKVSNDLEMKPHRAHDGLWWVDIFPLSMANETVIADESYVNVAPATNVGLLRFITAIFILWRLQFAKGRVPQAIPAIPALAYGDFKHPLHADVLICLLYTSDAADE